MPQNMLKVHLRLGLHPDPGGGAYSAFADPLAGFGGGEGEGKRGGKEGKGCPLKWQAWICH